MSRSLLGLPRTYWVLWLGQFVNRLGGFVLTFLPLFLTEHHRYSDAAAGRVLALYGLGGLVGASLGGWSADRYGRRRTILAGVLFNAAVLLVFGVAPAGPLVALCAVLHGVSNGYGPALNASVSDVVPPADRARAFGYFYWAVNLGFTLAAVLGGALSRRGYVWLFVGDALTSLILAGIVLRWVPETRPDAATDRARPSALSAVAVFVDPRFTGFAAAQLLALTVFLQGFVALPLQERADGVSVRDVGLIAALNGVVIVAVQPLFLRVTRGQPAWRLLALASSLLGAASLVAARTRTVAGFAACMTVLSLGEVAFSGAAPSFVAHVAPADRRGSYQGAYSLCWALASLLAPLAGPGARARYGAPVMWTVCAAVCALTAVMHATATRRAEANRRV